MGRKRTRTGQFLLLFAAGMILAFFSGCAARQDLLARQGRPQPREIEPQPPPPRDLSRPLGAPGEVKEAAPTGGDSREVKTARKPPEREKESATPAAVKLQQARKALLRGEYERAAEEAQAALAFGEKNGGPGDRVLYTLGLIHAHAGNPKRNCEKAVYYFKKLLRDFPLSSLAEEAKVWAAVLQENLKLNEGIGKIREENSRLSETNAKLTERMEKSKQVDIAVEEKKRELRAK